MRAWARILPSGVQATMAASAAALLLGGFMVNSPAAAQTRAEFDRARQRMVDEAIVAAGVKDARVIQAMRDTPRHEFVEPSTRRQAYFDMGLPIGEGQTISSPFIVAYMTECIDPQPTDKVLEIGTGSGYQAAVLSPLVKEVYTIEIVEPLGKGAARVLERLNYKNVHVKVGDGYLGWPEHAPFDKIIVTCSPEKIPQPLVDQLREGGLIVVPVGERYQQTLYLMRKKNGEMQAEALRPTLFVPMTGAAEDKREVQPDPADPQVINGDFELPLGDNGFLQGWYYERLLTLESDARSPQGRQYVTMRNQDAGRAAHVMQGFPIDGRKIVRVDFSVWVKYANTRTGPNDAKPAAAITFYDDRRAEVGIVLLGPFLGDSGWREVSRSGRVPVRAREAILRLGLFGATGEISFDNVRMSTVKY
jgi:protein-L-isoaspartate(D-aspartate) O-methyltransferase